MFFVLLGVAAGAAIALGPLAWLHAPVDWAIATLVSFGESAAARLLAAAPLGGHGTLAEALAVGIGAVLPGAAAIVLILAARAATGLRRGVAVVVGLAGLGAFVVLPFWQAAVFALACATLAAFASLVTGIGVVVPLTATATVLAARNVAALLDGGDTRVNDGAARLATLTGTGDPQLWALVLTVAALAPFAWAALAAFRDA